MILRGHSFAGSGVYKHIFCAAQSNAVGKLKELQRQPPSYTPAPHEAGQEGGGAARQDRESGAASEAKRTQQEKRSARSCRALPGARQL